jgi:hypothetical protein
MNVSTCGRIKCMKIIEERNCTGLGVKTNLYTCCRNNRYILLRDLCNSCDFDCLCYKQITYENYVGSIVSIVSYLSSKAWREKNTHSPLTSVILTLHHLQLPRNVVRSTDPRPIRDPRWA